MKNYFGIFLILLLPLLAVLGYASMDESISTELTRIDLRHIDSFLAADPDSALVAEAEIADSTAVDTTPQRILLIGDSMVEGLGLRMAEYAAHNGHTLTFVTWVSSTTDMWGSDTLRHYLNEAKPTFVVMTIGGNEQSYCDEALNERNIKRILDIIGDTPYVWICTPEWEKDSPFNVVPQRVCGRQRFFDSRRLTLDRAQDHRHPTYQAGSIWMDSVALWLQSPLREHPIVMQRPPKGTAKECTKYYIKPDPESKGKKRFIVTKTQYFGNRRRAITTVQSAAGLEKAGHKDAKVRQAADSVGSSSAPTSAHPSTGATSNSSTEPQPAGAAETPAPASTAPTSSATDNSSFAC